MDEPNTTVLPGEVVPYSPPQPADDAALSIRGDSILTQEAIEAAERRVDAIKKIKLIALRVTSPSDWIDVSGTPYLQTSGVEKVARLFGISVVNPRMQIRRMEDEEGRIYEQYIATVRAVMNGGEIECEGIAATNDDFFALRTDEQGNKYKLPFSEVDIASVRKKALTNALRRGVVKLLGLGSFTWEEIPRVVSPDQVKGYQHRGAGQIPPSQEQAAPPPNGKNVKADLWGICMELGGGEPQVATSLLEKFSSFTGRDGTVVKGFTDLNHPKFSAKWLASSYGAAKKALEEWRKTHGGPA